METNRDPAMAMRTTLIATARMTVLMGPPL